MAANTNPVFSRAGHINWNAANITAANTTRDGTGTVTNVFTSDLTEGSYLQRLVVRSRGTNVATVMRVFINNGADSTVAANNSLIAEIGIAASTASEVAAMSGQEIPLNIILPATYKINVTLGTAVAAGFSVTAIGGKY